MADFLMPKLINYLSTMLQRVAESNDLNWPLSTQKISAFYALSRPNISVQSYLERIFKYANCSPTCFVVAYVYLDRFVKKQPFFPINSLNVHRLLITSVLVSIKFMDDICYNNAYYAKVGGISTAEMNLLEVDFLFGLGFQLNVSPNTFHNYCNFIQTQMLVDSPALQSTPTIIPTISSATNPKPLCSIEDEDSQSTAPQHHQQLAV